MANVLVWADIPVIDMERARRFYSEMLAGELTVMPGGMWDVAVPPREMGPIAFDLTTIEGLKPCADGITIYFDSAGDIDGMVRRAEAAGGTIQSPPTDMGPMVGVLAFVIDTEGNRIGIRQASAHGTESP